MKWHILSVDDDPDIGRQVKQLLEVRARGGGDQFVVDALQNFDEAMQKLDAMLYDLIILDVFKGRAGMNVEARPGAELLEDIKKRCFAPVIFYTALPSSVGEHKSELVRVVHKTSGGMRELRRAVAFFIDTRLPLVNRKLINYFFKVQAEYMWHFVQPNWKKLKNVADTRSLAYLLARRLAVSLSRDNIHHLINSLGRPANRRTEDTAHPVEYYIHPSLGEQSNAGDVLLRKGTKNYHVILTPSCDMFISAGRKHKSEYVLIARCVPIRGMTEGRQWKEHASESKKKELVALMKNNKQGGQSERYYFLPGTFFLPSLCVDFQLIQAIPFSDLKKFERVASLDSPFAESLLNRFCRYMGRFGTPDLSQEDLEELTNALRK